VRPSTAAAIVAAALAVVACADEDEPSAVERAVGGGEPTKIDAPAPPGTERGRELVAASGCLGCHRVGSTGNPGPGPDLTHIGSNLPEREIEGVLVDPTPPMPSYRRMPARDRREIVRYLAALR
jgi:ubiquinol-cytochrome c reductase cytochrome b subunit/menaquinol-cytochrome c reductase cytochrome b/c subunit